MSVLGIRVTLEHGYRQTAVFSRGFYRFGLVVLVLASVPGLLFAVPARPPKPPKPTPQVQKLLDAAAGSAKDGLPRLRIALERARALKDRCGEGLALFWMGRCYELLGDQPNAIKYYGLALPVNHQVGDLDTEDATATNMGLLYSGQGEVDKAFPLLQRSLSIERRLGRRRDESASLTRLGLLYYRKGDDRLALPCLQKALVIASTNKDPLWEASALSTMGLVYLRQGQPLQSADVLRRALIITRANGNKVGEATVLNNIGLLCSSISDFEKAAQMYEQALAIEREIGDAGQGRTLGNLMNIYDDLGQPEKALQYGEQALALQREEGDRWGEARAMANMARIYQEIGQWEKALSYDEQALVIQRAIKDRAAEAITLANMGDVYRESGKRAKALEFYAMALHIERQVRDRHTEATILGNVGITYSELGQLAKALDYYRRSLPILRELGDRQSVSGTLNNIAFLFSSNGQNEDALRTFEQVLTICEEIHDRSGEATAINNIGAVYKDLGRPDKALQYFEKALPIRRAIRDRAGEAATLSCLGELYQSLGKHEEALRYMEQALEISRSIGNRSNEAVSLDFIGKLYKEVSPDLAIWYGKRAVNLSQALRTEIRSLSKETRSAYKETVADRYRSLADLLVSQGRIPEAEAVLRLLKDDEVFQFVRGSESNLGDGVAYTPVEADWDREYEEQTKGLAQLGTREQALLALRVRTPEQDAELKDLDQKVQAAERAFQAFLDRMLAKSKALNVGANRLEKIGNAESIQDTLGHLPAGTVAVYTLAAPDALRLIVVTATTSRAHTVALKPGDLNKLVGAFRAALQSPSTDPKPSGKALYDALIKPIEEDLKGAGAKTIMWSLDGPLRYIPIAALWDGEHYLVERFDNSIFNPSSAERLERDIKPDWRALVAGVSTQRKVKDDDGIEHSFAALTGVPKELDSVVAAFPGSKQLLDPSFTVENFQAGLLTRPSLVHLATHFSFSSGDETKSFLLTGGGPVLSIGQARTMSAISLQGVSLLTLSACETGLGGTYGDGSEVESISVIFQKKGAEAVLSTLWSVADEPTRLLMTRFYMNRKSHPDWTKLECLRQAQLALLRGGEKGSGGVRAESVTGGTSFKPDANAPLSHPYYWAPFVLSGNWK